MRAFAEEAYGIPPEQVIGSSVKTRFEISSSGSDLIKLAEFDSFDDREVKPANIYLHIGRRPILAFGNSDGDLAMLRYTKTGTGPRLALLDSPRRRRARIRLRPRISLEPARRSARQGERIRHHGRQHEGDWKTVFAE